MALPLVAKPASILPLGPVDISRLQRLVERMSETAWLAEDAVKENAFPCFHHTRHVIFRFIPGNRDPEQFYANPSWEIWKDVLQPIMMAASTHYGMREPAFPKVMLAKLDAGQEIDLHRDGAGSNLRTHKIHVPLVTNPHALFRAGGESIHLAVGEAYEVNNVGEHGAVNHGATDRIHLIFELFDAACSDGSVEEEGGRTAA